jgi:hypothetical protein
MDGCPEKMPGVPIPHGRSCPLLFLLVHLSHGRQLLDEKYDLFYRKR